MIVEIIHYAMKYSLIMIIKTNIMQQHYLNQYRLKNITNKISFGFEKKKPLSPVDLIKRKKMEISRFQKTKICLYERKQ